MKKGRGFGCFEPGCEYVDPENPDIFRFTTREELQQHVESEHPVDKISDVNAKDGEERTNEDAQELWKRGISSAPCNSPALVRAAIYGMEERCSELLKREEQMSMVRMPTSGQLCVLPSTRNFWTLSNCWSTMELIWSTGPTGGLRIISVKHLWL